MNVDIKCKNIEIQEPLREYLQKKAENFKKYLNNIDEVNIFLYHEKYQNACEITIYIKGILIKSQDASSDIRTAIDKAGHKITAQIKKYKEKLKDHKAAKPDKTFKAKIDILEQPDYSKPKFKIVKTSTFPVTPMDIEQAVMQMELANNQFHVFVNKETQKINIVYKRPDGCYGRLEPGE